MGNGGHGVCGAIECQVFASFAEFVPLGNRLGKFIRGNFNFLCKLFNGLAGNSPAVGYGVGGGFLRACASIQACLIENEPRLIRHGQVCHASAELGNAVAVANVAGNVGARECVLLEVAAGVEVLVITTTIHTNGDAMLFAREGVQSRNEFGILNVAQRHPVGCTAMHMPEVCTNLHAGTVAVAGVRLARIRPTVYASVFFQHALVALEAAGAHDDTTFGVVSFTVGDNADNFTGFVVADHLFEGS